MNTTRTLSHTAACMLLILVPFTTSLRAQNDGGDQFLDGIGETALLGRYLLNGNTQDRTRNGHHASLRGGESAFVDDPRFGRILALSGTGAHLEIPGESLAGQDTISVVGWVFLRSAAPWQRFFDFGQNTAMNFFCALAGDDSEAGYRARITVQGWESELGPGAPQLATNVWTHLAVVLDSAGKTLKTYRDGVQVGNASNVILNLEHVLNQSAGAANHLYIGRSQYDTDPTLNARLYDLRIYSIALTDQQVATIRNNALSGTTGASPDGATVAGIQATIASGNIHRKPLAAVPDISVETIQGHLPRLPQTIPAVYRDDQPGPSVPVIWPSPTNNLQVLETGSYVITGRVARTDFQPRARVTVRKTDAAVAPIRQLTGFPLDRVVLNQDEQQRDTQFIRNRDKFIRALADSNPDRFLYMFRDAFGQRQPAGAGPLGGWDDQTTRLRGHASGHYLTAIAQAYASSVYDENLRTNFLHKMNYLIETLYDLSRKSGTPTNAGGDFVADPTAVPPGPGKSGYDSNLTTNGIRTDYWNWGKGFISAYPPDQFIMLEQGASYGGGNNQIWAPYYTLHKILAGLMDCYEVGGNRKALQIAQDMGLWVHQRLKVLPTATRISMWNRYIAGEYGGMNEAMARLFRLTQDERFLECARLFDNINFFFGDANHSHGLACNVDTLRGKHANQHIPQITGALETYRNTHQPEYYRVADNFWDICTGGYMYSIGGVAGAKNPNNAECFTAQPDTLFENGFSNVGQNETCGTYNLLKLSRELFLFSEDPKYMDYYERALYNHILASVAENNAGNTYHVPLNPGARKQFGNARLDGFTCCNGTALESSTKLQDSIYFQGTNNASLYVNLYVPSTLNWMERKVTVKQTTSFPHSDTVRINLTGGGKFEIKFRVPAWATQGFTVKINGQEVPVKAAPGTYAGVRRTWGSNDTIELRLPFGFHLIPVMDQPNIASLFYGPVLLAAEESGPRSQWRPMTLDAEEIGKFIIGDPAKLRFSVGEAKLKPFYETYDRHSVYFDVSWK